MDEKQNLKTEVPDVSSIYPQPTSANIQQGNLNAEQNITPAITANNDSRFRSKKLLYLGILLLLLIIALLAVAITKKDKNKDIANVANSAGTVNPNITSSVNPDLFSTYTYTTSTGQKFQIKYYKNSQSVTTKDIVRPHPDKNIYNALISPSIQGRSYPIWLYILPNPNLPNPSSAKRLYETYNNCALPPFSVRINSLSLDSNVCYFENSYVNGPSYQMNFYKDSGIYTVIVGENNKEISDGKVLKMYNAELKYILSTITPV